MKRAGAIISLVISLILFGIAISGFVDDTNEAPERMQDGFADLARRDYSAVDRGIQDEEDAKRAIDVEALAGAAFLVAGLVLFGKKSDMAGHNHAIDRNEK